MKLLGDPGSTPLILVPRVYVLHSFSCGPWEDSGPGQELLNLSVAGDLWLGQADGFQVTNWVFSRAGSEDILGRGATFGYVFGGLEKGTG